MSEPADIPPPSAFPLDRIFPAELRTPLAKILDVKFAWGLFPIGQASENAFSAIDAVVNSIGPTCQEGLEALDGLVALFDSMGLPGDEPPEVTAARAVITRFKVTP